MNLDALFAHARDRVNASIDRRCDVARARIHALACFHRRGMGQRFRQQFRNNWSKPA